MNTVLECTRPFIASHSSPLLVSSDAIYEDTNKSKGFIKRIFKLKFHEEKWRGFPFVHSERVRNDLHRYIFLAKRYFPTP